MARVSGNDKEKPLRGVVFCCTSIAVEQRSELAAIGIEMGAEQQLHLTSDVTHLVVGETNTPKYKYVAREREDVRVVKAEWMFAVRDAWVSAEEIDLDVLEREHRWKPLEGLAVCITGFDNLEFRAQLQEHIQENGADYRGDLTKSVTHLIAAGPKGKKYEYAESWGITVVSLKWLKESLDRGMNLDASLYHPKLPLDDQGKGAWNRKVRLQSTDLKRQRETVTTDDRPRKLRRTHSERISNQSENLWGDIVGSGSQTNTSERGQLRPSRSMSHVRLQVEESKSFATDTSTKEHNGIEDKPDVKDLSKPTISKKPGYMSSCTVYLSGFGKKQTSILRHILLENDCQIVDGMDDFDPSATRCYVLVPYTSQPRDVPQPSKRKQPLSTVTEFWVEECMERKSFVDPLEYVPAQFPRIRPVEDFQDQIINATGFGGRETLHIQKLTTLLGATYDEYLRSRVTVLVSSSSAPQEDKFVLAYQHKIPVVREDWLWSCIHSGKAQDTKPYLLKIPSAIKARAQRIEHEAQNSVRKPAARAEENRNLTHKTVVSEHTKVKIQAPTETKPKSKPGADFFEDTSTSVKPFKQQAASSPMEQFPKATRSSASATSPRKQWRTPKPEESITITRAQGANANELDRLHHLSPDRSKDVETQQSERVRDLPDRSSNLSPNLQPLCEISPNSPPKPGSRSKNSPSGCSSQNRRSASIFAKCDGAASSEENPPEPASASITSINSAIHELLRKRPKIKPQGPEETHSTSPSRKPKTTRLLGRALSNMSNHSASSSAAKAHPNAETQGPTRASSVDSLNTDGVGSVIGSLDHDLTDQNSRNGVDSQPNSRPSSRRSHIVNRYSTDSQILKGKADNWLIHGAPASAKEGNGLIKTTSNPDSLDSKLLARYGEESLTPGFGTGEEELPAMTQLLWEEPEESKRLREVMVEGKKGRERPKEEKAMDYSKAFDRKIRDDEVVAAAGWGAEGRTRTKSKGKER
ncbi:MAG: hypothetical protein Q9227_007114 [Pyrenula ochraceoflavens]